MHSKVVWPGVSGVSTRHVAKVGRNASCPCGSGKKYKDCHEKEGSGFLEKLARRQDKERRKELGVPWYRWLIFWR